MKPIKKIITILLLIPLSVYLLTGLAYFVLGCESAAWVAVTCSRFGSNIGPLLNNLLYISFAGVVLSFLVGIPALIISSAIGDKNKESKSNDNFK